MIHAKLEYVQEPPKFVQHQPINAHISSVILQLGDVWNEILPMEQDVMMATCVRVRISAEMGLAHLVMQQLALLVTDVIKWEYVIPALDNVQIPLPQMEWRAMMEMLAQYQTSATQEYVSPKLTMSAFRRTSAIQQEHANQQMEHVRILLSMAQLARMEILAPIRMFVRMECVLLEFQIQNVR